jgi:hypothetical protein
MPSLRARLTLAAAALLVPAGAAGAAIHRGAPPGSRPPAGYTVVEASFDVPAGTQMGGAVFCPGRTVAIGGAAFVDSPDVLANVNSSFPTKRGWIADVNNASGADTQARAIAICARKPAGYALVTSADVLNPAGTQSTAIATCPAGTAPLGGGFASSSFDTAVNGSSSFPLTIQAAWRVDEKNGSGADATLESLVVCGVLRGYTVVQDPDFVDAAEMQQLTITDCPAPTVPISPGLLSHTGDLRANINGMRPGLSSWQIFANNASPFDVTETAFAVCAGR